MRKWAIERVYPMAVGVLSFLALIILIVKRLIGSNSMSLIGTLLAVLAVLVLVLGLSYRAANNPKEIPLFGDPVLDDEIDNTLRQRATKNR